MMKIALVLALVVAIALPGCATRPEKLPKGPESHALAPQPSGALADLENSLRPRLGAGGSGWTVLDSNENALRYRLALIDSATSSLDIAYYVWWESSQKMKSAGKLQERRVSRHPTSRIPVGS